MMMVELAGGKVDQKDPEVFCSPCPHYSSPSHAPLCALKHISVCLSGGRAVCHVVFLATLARLHDHIGQLLHLKVKINSNAINNLLSHKMLCKHFTLGWRSLGCCGVVTLCCLPT